MNADILKTKMLNYWRFKRGYHLCATEVNTGIEIADIMLSNEKEIIEIEVKISYSDFKKDFKKAKHQDLIYLKANKFYFCIPETIKKKVCNYFLENKLKYGLISFNGEMTIIQSCRKLKSLDEHEMKRINNYILMRATSEMVELRRKLYK